MKTIGLVGKGIVGTAVYEGMKHAFKVKWHDSKWTPSADGKCDSLGELVNSTDGPIFLCLPTPMNADGSADLSIIKSVLQELNDIVLNKQVIAIKSTVPPGTTHSLSELYQNLRLVFNPEFLTEANAVEDFQNQDRIIIGGPHEATRVIKQMYQTAYPDVPTTKTSATIAELVKYITNCFLAVKVSFANEIYQICEKLEIDYDKCIEYATKDKRLGASHWSVPGPVTVDGRATLGFGFSCLPKDLNALISLAKQLKVDPKVMSAAWEKNLEVRPPEDRDWEKMKNKAVV